MKSTPAPQSTPTSDKSAQSEGSLSVLHDLADTTWRIAVPVVLFALIGLFIDKQAGTGPWFTLLGTVVGFVFAGLLIKRQLSGIKISEEKER